MKIVNNLFIGNMEKQNFWSECLDLIKQQITNQAYETWFSDVEVLELNEEEIKLQVPNQYHYEWLEQKYRHLINEVIIKVGENPRVVNYNVNVSSKKINEIPKLNDQDVLPTPTYKKNAQLNDRYNFDNFIEGKGNQFAKAAAVSVAEMPGQSPFNPLLIYSTPGLGKTHLLQAIGNMVQEKNPNFRLIYITASFI